MGRAVLASLPALSVLSVIAHGKPQFALDVGSAGLHAAGTLDEEDDKLYVVILRTTTFHPHASPHGPGWLGRALVCPEEVRAELTQFVYECRGGEALGCEESGRVHVELEIVAPDDREFLVDVFGWSTGNEALTGNDGIVASTSLELRAGQVEHGELEYVEEGPCQPTDFERAHAQTQRSGCE